MAALIPINLGIIIIFLRANMPDSSPTYGGGVPLMYLNDGYAYEFFRLQQNIQILIAFRKFMDNLTTWFI